MALINNIFELRSDAFKMTVHHRRPIPTRTDTIGPWLEALTFLTWLGALTNSALVYLFSPSLLPSTSTVISTPDMSEFTVETLINKTNPADQDISGVSFSATADLLMKAALVALLASHGFILVRLVIRHIVDRVFWRGSKELEERETEIRRAREGELKGNNNGSKIGGEKVLIEREVLSGKTVSADEVTGEVDQMHFWEHDEGVDEIRRISKET